MATVDTYGPGIATPISGQQISADQYGIPMKAAVQDLDRRVQALGIVAAPVTTASAGTVTSSTTETPDSVLGVYQFEAVAAPVTTASAGTVTSSTTETPDSVLGVYQFEAQDGVRYRLSLRGRGISGSIANDRYSVKFRYTLNGGTPTASSTLLGHDSTTVTDFAGGNGIRTVPHDATFIPGAGTVQVISTWQRVNGTGVGTPSGSCEMYAEAIGTV